MPSPALVDLDVLLTPVPGAHPAGEDLLYDGIYDAIAKARHAEEALPQGEWTREIAVADWAAVVRLTHEALHTRSKDLQLAVWLVEALVQRHDMAGLRDGLQVCGGLLERFWPVLYPRVEDGDLEPRIRLLEWLNRTVPSAIRAVPIVRASDGRTYSWWSWDESRRVENLRRQDQEAFTAAMADGKITADQFDRAAELTPLNTYQTLFDDLTDSAAACTQLARVVDDCCGRDAPSLGEIQKAITGCRTLVEDLGKRKGGFQSALSETVAATPPATAAPEAPTFQASQAPANPIHPTVLATGPQSRAEALRWLEVVATYFRRTEPHSPVSYLIQRAVRWGDMPLENWLQEVINDEAVLGRVRDTLGIQESETSTET